MIERLDRFIKEQGLSIRAFEMSICASNGLIRKAITNNTDIQSKWISAIVDNYPQLNTDWLLTGKGEMLNESNNAGIVNAGSYNNIGSMGSNVVSIQKSPAKSINQQIIGQSMEASYPTVEYKVSSLESEIQHLKQELLSKDKIISTLEELINMYKASNKQ
jgi:hypothetical protein